MRFEEPFFSGYVGEVRAWASQFAAENRIPGWVNAHYVWPDELRGIWDQLGDTRGGLIGIVGLQGVGKSSALQAIYRSRIEQEDAQRAQDLEAKGTRPSYLRDVLLFKWRRKPELFSSLLNGSHEASDTFLSRYLPTLWEQSSRTTHAPRATSPGDLRGKLERLLEETRAIMREANKNPDFRAISRRKKRGRGVGSSRSSFSAVAVQYCNIELGLKPDYYCHAVSWGRVTLCVTPEALTSI